MDFWHTLTLLNRRKWLLLGSVLITLLLTYGATRMMPSKWQATARFGTPLAQSLAAQAASPLTNNPALNEENFAKVSKSQLAMYNVMIKSPEVIEPALAKLNRSQTPQSVLDNISVSVNNARIFELTVVDQTYTQAEELANALAESFIAKYHSLYTYQATQIVKQLEAELAQVESKLAKTRQRYDAYRTRYRITNAAPGGMVSGAGGASSPAVSAAGNALEAVLTRLQALTTQRSQLSAQLTNAKARLAQKQQHLANLSPHTPAPSLPPDPLVQQLQTDLERAEQQVAELRVRYTDQHPQVQRALLEAETARKRLAQARASQAAPGHQPNPIYSAQEQSTYAIKEEIAGLQAQIAEVDRTIRQAEAEVKKFEGLGTPLATLLGDIASQTEARSHLLARLNNAQMAMDAAARQDPLVILERAGDFNPPVNVNAGRARKLLMLAGLCALLLSSGFIIVADSLDRRLRTTHQAENHLPGQVLAAIPQPSGTVTRANLARVTEEAPQALHSEAYRFLGLHLLNKETPRPRSLMSLSAKAEQGSTTTLCNLAITLAQAGNRVALIDANIRAPRLHQVFQLPNDFGYTDLLQDRSATAYARALHPTRVPNLTVITSGAIPYNPWEMFRSQRVSEVSNYLLKHYDYVLYDTPSALIFTDALNLAPVVDAAFLCVRAQEPLTGAEGRLIELLNQANVSVLGSVLNNVPLSVLEGYSNYQRYYGPTPGEAPALLSTSAAVAPSAPRSVSSPTQPA